MTMETYWYERQIKKYLLQFAAIFSDMHVMVGKNATREAGLIKVPIIHAPMDRVATAAAVGHTQNRMVRLPMLSCHISGYRFAIDRTKGSNVDGRYVYVPRGGILPDDGKTIYSSPPIPYDLDVDLHIYSSNYEQHFQILEQIFVLFNPEVQIQRSDAAYDLARIVAVKLKNISNDENFPPGTESGSIACTLSFTVEAFLTLPTEVRNNLVQKIILRVSAVSDPDIGTIFSSGSANSDIGAIFDSEDVPQTITDVNNLPPL